MNTKITALALCLSAGLTSHAWAAISPGQGAAGDPPGELFFTVFDATNQRSYTRDLGIQITDFLANPNQTISVAADALYQSTFNGVNPTTLVYSVGAFNNRFDDFPCCYGMVISSNNTPAQVFLPDFTALNTSLTVGGFYVQGANANDGGGFTDFGADLSGVSLPGDPGYYDGENWGGNIGFTVPFQTGATVGAAVSFHALLLDDAGVAVERTTFTNQWTLATDGRLTYGSLLDSDGDGLVDSADNCTLVQNASQLDVDGDGIGNHCDADFDNSCITNTVDLGEMKSVFFQSGSLEEDLDGSGTVNTVDLGILKSRFFQPPGPSGIPNVCD